MNLTNFAAVNLVPPPEPPAQTRHEDETRAKADRDQDKDDAFDRALKQEMERKALQALPSTNPIYMPFMQQPATPVVTASSDAVSGVAASGALSSAFALSALSAATAPAAAPADTGETAPAPAPVEQTPGPKPEPVAVVVEAGLPPVQPPTEGGIKAHLVDFPQLVVGQIRHAVRDNKPLTQLDFQLSPPHVGPVNLSVSYTQGVVGVQLTALSLQAKHALEGQVETIQQILTAHNLQPGQIKVVTAVGGKSGANGAGGKGDGAAAGFNLFSGGRRRNAGDDDGTVGQTRA